MIWLRHILAACAAAWPLAAQAAQLDVTANLDSGYSSNPLSLKDAEHGFVTGIGARAMLAGRRVLGDPTVYRFSYAPQFRGEGNDFERRQLNHIVNLRLQREVTPRLRMSVGTVLLEGDNFHENRSEVADAADAGSDGREDGRRFTSDTKLSLEGQVTARLGYFGTVGFSTEDFSGIGAIADSVGAMSQAGFTYGLSSRQTVGVGGVYQFRDFDVAQADRQDSFSHSVQGFLTYAHQLTRHLTLSLQAGPALLLQTRGELEVPGATPVDPPIRVEEETDQQVTYFASASLEREFSWGSLSATYERNERPTAGDDSTSVFDRVSLEGSRNLTKRTRVFAGASWSRNVFDRPAAAGVNDPRFAELHREEQSWRARLGFALNISRELICRVETSYRREERDRGANEVDLSGFEEFRGGVAFVYNFESIRL